MNIVANKATVTCILPHYVTDLNICPGSQTLRHIVFAL